VLEAWLVDLQAGRLEVSRSPASGGYREGRVLGRGEAVAPLAFPDRALRLGPVLGGA